MAEVVKHQEIQYDPIEDVQNPPDSDPEAFKGPIVGDKESTAAKQDEFAQSDQPVYKLKMKDLVSKYTAFRRIAPNGDCGWTCIIYGLLDLLICAEDTERFEALISRLKFQDTALTLRHGEWLYEDFRDDTLNLLRSLVEQLPSPAEATFLLTEHFRNPSTANSVIYYFRLIASTWMRDHQADYQDYLIDATVDDYCTIHIDRPQSYLEELGIKILYDAVISAVDVDIGVIHLDRSPGDSCNIHKYSRTTSDASTTKSKQPTVWIFYHENHYDLMYAAEDIETPPN